MQLSEDYIAVRAMTIRVVCAAIQAYGDIQVKMLLRTMSQSTLLPQPMSVLMFMDSHPLSQDVRLLVLYL